ncbi:hypothetical protein [Actinomadura bangladeshensis]|uniref:Uncharacterized protein n=1 Tax=Actinomadura bangladeshensis TaxID=453573 RepID=A0A6L9QCA8_9ACTN|nr:hypothetical protein [Actinomadura bangladeshensis]NEA22656.1 hypothetical protein [Actinomadura bangladeshensis]
MSDALFDLPAAPPLRPKPEKRPKSQSRTAPQPAGQLDVIVGDPEARRLADGLICLRDAVPEAMSVVLHLADWNPTEDGGYGMSGDWAYTIRRRGLRFERRHDSGWSGRASRMRCLTWAELTDILGSDPRRAEIVAWSDALVEPAWQQRMRPHELWPDPGSWHPSYIENDHKHPGWPERIAAWTALQAMCTDAITRLEAS